MTLDSDEEDQQPPAPSAQNSQSSCALSSFSPPPPLRGPASPVPSQPPPLQFVAPPPPPFPGACAFGQGRRVRVLNTWRQIYSCCRADNQTPPRRKGSAKVINFTLLLVFFISDAFRLHWMGSGLKLNTLTDLLHKSEV